MCKLPIQFREMFLNDEKDGRVQLSEDIGEKLARWAAGDAAVAEPEPLSRRAQAKQEADYLISLFEAVRDAASLASTEVEGRRRWPKLHKDDSPAVLAAIQAAKKRVAEQPSREPGEESAADYDPDPAKDLPHERGNLFGDSTNTDAIKG